MDHNHASGSKDSCPITRLPPELRETIYDYYFALTNVPHSQPHAPRFEISHGWGWRASSAPKQANKFQTLKPYLSMIQLSSTVRAETIATIYQNCLRQCLVRSERRIRPERYWHYGKYAHAHQPAQQEFQLWLAKSQSETIVKTPLTDSSTRSPMSTACTVAQSQDTGDCEMNIEKQRLMNASRPDAQIEYHHKQKQLCELSHVVGVWCACTSRLDQVRLRNPLIGEAETCYNPCYGLPYGESKSTLLAKVMESGAMRLLATVTSIWTARMRLFAFDGDDDEEDGHANINHQLCCFELDSDGESNALVAENDGDGGGSK